jgi:hypothetical protein
MKIKQSFQEVDSVTELPQGKRFRVVLIQEGLGNMKDAFYYSKESLQTAVPIFEGKKIFTDHPTNEEESERPERSVKDVLGHFENIALAANDGRHQLMGDLVLAEGAHFSWAKGLLAHALEYAKKFPGQDFIGLSINANGEAEHRPITEIMKDCPDACKPKLQKAMEFGVDSVKLATKITDAISCDLVTAPGAGGKILAMLEGDKEMKKKNQEAEAPVKQESPAPAPAAPQAAPAAPEQNSQEHPDAAQDAELIKSMIAKYLTGIEGDHTQSVTEMSNVYGEMGMERPKAVEAGAMHVKAASVLMSKQPKVDAAPEQAPEKKEPAIAEAEACAKEGDEKVITKDQAPFEIPNDKKPETLVKITKKDEAPADVKESDKIIELTAKIAALEGKINEYELADHMEKKLMESKLERKVTKMFKESIKDRKVKTKEQFNSLLELFVEGFKANSGEVVSNANPEKFAEVTTGALSFKDCV